MSLTTISRKSLVGRSMKDQRKTIQPKLKLVSEDISNAIEEARRVKELSIQEEVIVELDKVNAVLEQAKNRSRRSRESCRRIFSARRAGSASRIFWESKAWPLAIRWNATSYPGFSLGFWPVSQDTLR